MLLFVFRLREEEIRCSLHGFLGFVLVLSLQLILRRSRQISSQWILLQSPLLLVPLHLQEFEDMHLIMELEYYYAVRAFVGQTRSDLALRGASSRLSRGLEWNRG